MVKNKNKIKEDSLVVKYNGRIQVDEKRSIGFNKKIIADKDVSVSIIAPFYNEAKSNVIDIFFYNLIPAMEKITKDFEIICVDDGSKDNTYLRLLEYAKKDNRIKIVKFSRNFGKEIALAAGFKYASKKCAIPMDADLQDPIELLPVMIKEWQYGHKAVLAKRFSRSEGLLKRIGCNLFYKCMRIFSNIDIPSNTGDFRLVDRQLIDEFNKLCEKQRYIRGLWAWIGFEYQLVYFDRPDRIAGNPSQSWRKLFELASNAIFSFTNMPLRFWFVIGSLISFIAFIFGLWIIINTLIYGSSVRGYPSLMVTILFFGGIQLISIGVLGEYIGRIYTETKDRPLFIVECEDNFNTKENKKKR